MNWKLKCLAFYACLAIPKLYGVLQRFTGNEYFTLTDEVIDAYSFHLKNFKGGTAVEIGAGTNLLAALLLSHKGAKVHAFDVARIATVEKVNHVIEQLAKRFPGNWPLLKTLNDLSLYRIHYHAPRDFKLTTLPGGSVDFIYSTSTLEHIPPKEFPGILNTCQRIGPKAIHSHIIGYVDHYAHSDSSISYFNFYRYGDEWRWFNPPNHYQNRLRHSDFVALFKAHGFEVHADTIMALESRRDRTLKHDPIFDRYPEQDLYAHDGLFMLSRSERPQRSGVVQLSALRSSQTLQSETGRSPGM